jgi:hypothetical protein
MWSIVQAIVNHPGETDYENFWVYFPINPKSIFGKNGTQLPDGSSNAWKGEVAPGVYGVQFFPSKKLIYADPHKGWIAYADLRDGIVYATTFDIFEGAPYPDNARVTVYVNDANPPYLEVEVKSPIVEISAGGGRYTFTENWWAAKVRAPMLDINSVGVIAKKLSYNPAAHSLSAIYGVFHKGIAHIVCIDALGKVLTETTSVPVSPLSEFQLQEIIDIPDSARTVEIRIYNNQDAMVGILDSANVSELLTGINAPN